MEEYEKMRKWRLYPKDTQPGEAVLSWTLSHTVTLISHDWTAKDADSYGIRKLAKFPGLQKLRSGESSCYSSFYLIVCLETFSLAMFFEELGPGRWLQSKSQKKQLLHRELKWMKIGIAEGCRDCKGCGSLQHLFLVAGVCQKKFGPLCETKAISRSLAELVLVFLRAGAWLPGCTFPDGRNGFANKKQQQPDQHYYYSHD